MAEFHVYSGADAGSMPEIRHVKPSDIWAALAQGLDDSWAMPSHLAFLGVVGYLASRRCCNLFFLSPLVMRS
jgi:uncharacterized membrane protein